MVQATPIALLLCIFLQGPGSRTDLGPVFSVLPVNRGGTVLAPAAPLAQWLGAGFEVRGTEAVAGPDLSRPRLVLRAGDPVAILAGKPRELPLAPEIIHGEFFVPLRAFAEHLGAWVNSEGRCVHLAMPQLGLRADLMAPPDPSDHLGKIWAVVAQWFGLRDARDPGDPWELLSARRRQRILASVGADAPRLLRERFDATLTRGVRIVADGTNLQDGTGWVLATLVRKDGSASAVRFEMVVERTGWKVDRVEEQILLSARSAGEAESEAPAPEPQSTGTG